MNSIKQKHFICLVLFASNMFPEFDENEKILFPID